MEYIIHGTTKKNLLEILKSGYINHSKKRNSNRILDKDSKIKSRKHLKYICHQYKSYEKENIIYNLLPDLAALWNQKLIYEQPINNF
jgi:hypothetical protein